MSDIYQQDCIYKNTVKCHSLSVANHNLSDVQEERCLLAQAKT